MSGSSMHASNSRSQMPASRQRMKRRCVLLQPPYSGGKSRQGAPVLTIQRTALTNFLLFLAISHKVSRFSEKNGSVFAPHFIPKVMTMERVSRFYLSLLSSFYVTTLPTLVLYPLPPAAMVAIVLMSILG